MAWIKSYQALEKHPKLLKLMKILDVNQNEAIGIVHKFWWWCLDYAETGNLSDVDPEILGNTLGVPNLLEALKTSGFVDIDPLRVHDWLDYAYEFLKLKYHTSNPKKYDKIVRYRHKIQAIPKVIPKAIPKGRQDKIDKIDKIEKIREDKLREDAKEKKYAEGKPSAVFFRDVLTYYITKFQERFSNEKPAINYGKDNVVVSRARGLFIDTSWQGLIDWFLVSDKAKEFGHSLSICFSTHTINQWKVSKSKKTDAEIDAERGER